MRKALMLGGDKGDLQTKPTSKHAQTVDEQDCLMKRSFVNRTVDNLICIIGYRISSIVIFVYNLSIG